MREDDARERVTSDDGATTARETRESATESAEPLEVNEWFNECFNARARVNE